MPGSEEESVLLQHFVDAQDQPVVGSDVPDETVYERAIVQLKDGVLPSYDELWFIFPRVIEDAEASRKRLARQYSIKSYKEAKAYYFDNVLYGNLIDAIDAVRAGQGFDLDDGFGRGARKFKPWFRECLTLFSEIEADFDEPNETVFRDSLDEFFGGDPDEDVIDLVYDFVDHPEMMSEFGTVTSLDEDEDEDLVVEEDPMDLEIEEPEYELKGFLASRVDKGVLKYQADWDWPVPDLTFYPATVRTLNAPSDEAILRRYLGKVEAM